MVRYFLNWMGPVSMRWYEDNNIPYVEEWQDFKSLRKYGVEAEPRMIRKYLKDYCCGRIDVSGVPDEPYGIEYGVGVMEKVSWYALGQYLNDLVTEEVLSKEELLTMFEEESGYQIQWFKDE